MLQHSLLFDTANHLPISLICLQNVAIRAHGQEKQETQPFFLVFEYHPLYPAQIGPAFQFVC